MEWNISNLKANEVLRIVKHNLPLSILPDLYIEVTVAYTCGLNNRDRGFKPCIFD